MNTRAKVPRGAARARAIQEADPDFAQAIAILEAEEPTPGSRALNSGGAPPYRGDGPSCWRSIPLRGEQGRITPPKRSPRRSGPAGTRGRPRISGITR